MAEFKGYISPDVKIKSDPINLIFFGNASAASVESLLLSLAPTPWHPARHWQRTGHWPRPSTTMLGYIDDTASGGPARWKRPDAELEIGQTYSGTRIHLRLYQCFVPDRGGRLTPVDLGTWCIGAVHREHWAFPRWHIVHGWQEAQEFVEECFADDPRLGRIFHHDLGNAGWYQGYEFDGEATFIELL